MVATLESKVKKGFPKDPGGLIDKSDDKKTDDRLIWDISTQFLWGNQWLNLDTDRSLLASSEISGVQYGRVTCNFLADLYRTVCSHLSVSYPSCVIRPASTSTEDITKAKLSEVALQYFWDEASLNEKFELLIRYLILYGTAGVHTYWDDASEKIEVKIYNPYDIFFEEDASEVDDSRWIATRTFSTRKELLGVWADTEEDGKKVSHARERKIIKKASPSGDHEGRTRGRKQPSDRIAVHEFHFRDGRHAIVVGNEYLLQRRVNQKFFPVHIARYTAIPTRIWGLSMIAPALDLQFNYNKVRTQINRNADLVGNPKMLLPRQCGVKSSSFTNEPGEKVGYNSVGGKPEYLNAPPMPAYILDSLVRFQSEMQDVMGIHSATLGKRAAGVTSGVAIENLTSRDTSQLRVTQLEIEKLAKGIAIIALHLMGKHYDKPIMMRQMDHIGSLVYERVKNTDIVDRPEVFVEAGSMFRDDQEIRDEKIMRLLQMELIDPETAMKEMSFRTGHSFITEKVAMMAHADDLLHGVIKGHEIEIFSTDDEKVVLEVFTKYTRTVEFYDLPEDRREAIRDVIIALETAGMPDEQYQAALMARKTYPRTPSPNQTTSNRIGNIMAQGSPESMDAQAREQKRVATVAGGARQGKSILTGDHGALRTRAPGGGGL